MPRFVHLILVVCFAITPVLAATPTVEYASPHTQLTYRYVHEEQGARGQSWIYRFRTGSGGLQLTLRSTEDLYTVTTQLEGASSREVVSVSEPAGPGDGNVELSWPDLRMRARYMKPEGAEALERLDGWMPDCEFIVDGKLARTKRDLLELVTSDSKHYGEPPEHLQQLMAALYSARYLPLLAADCDEDVEPLAGACYYDHQNYGDCISCCETYSGVSMAVCAFVLRKICLAPWCRRFGLSLCGGMVAFGSNVCAIHNCRGKPGDPSCDPNQVCEGQCMNFCGPGWSSGCGNCDDQGPYEQACCN